MSASPERSLSAAPLDETVDSPWHARPLEDGESGAWDAGVTQSHQACVFLKSEWLDRMAAALDCRVVRLGCYKRGRLVGGLAGRESSTESEPALARIDLIPYSGVWLDSGAAHRARRAARRECAALTALAAEAARRFGRVELDCHPTNIDVRPFSWSGWRTEVRYTYLTDLTRDFESRIDPDVRRRAGIARRNGVRFDEFVPADQFDPLWTLTHERQRIPRPIGGDALVDLLESLRRSFSIRIHGARLPGGRLAAANVVVVDGRRAWYWLAAFDSRLAATGANQLCLLETLRCVAAHADTFDWVGANTPGVADYKESFGPALTPYYRATLRRTVASASSARNSMRRRLLSPIFRRSAPA